MNSTSESEWENRSRKKGKYVVIHRLEKGNADNLQIARTTAHVLMNQVLVNNMKLCVVN